MSDLPEQIESADEHSITGRESLAETYLALSPLPERLIMVGFMGAFAVEAAATYVPEKYHPPILIGTTVLKIASFSTGVIALTAVLANRADRYVKRKLNL